MAWHAGATRPHSRGARPGRFADLYGQLLDQFEAVSYGDALFGAVVMVPLEPRHPSELRRLVWSERPHALRALTTRPDQMLVPLEQFVASPEPDQVVRTAYRRALDSGQVTAARNPALFRIASALSGAA
ncbi:RNA polymerase II-associated protein 1-like [Pollicipes pollicipes]|uniref:RNA polymerase II-associated protein 1-like n=1 Tax=Pollicipes pollicipes TaxID=41117 RepID=UPI001884B6E9|nr:RNA polymerase II-associated protein 1-like [Pollicipes pollicipes]